MSKATILAAATAVLIIVLIAAFRNGKREKFLGAISYNPCFIDPLGASRYTCKGYTSGLMPSLETEPEGGWLCPGAIGVPP